MRPELPSGTVTFLFTDIEGSTKLLHELGAKAYAEALLEHRRVLREAFARHGGVEVDTQGDAFFVAFPTAPGAVQAALEAQGALSEGPIQVRMGLHTGEPHLTDEGYVGEVVHKGARIASAGHGGQVLLSKETRDAAPADVTDLGEHRLKDFAVAVPIFQLGSERFPPLKTISNTNLPRPASSFVGREKETEEIVSLLQDGARLLTLTGPGGTGKTRLSIEAAAELVPDFKAGVFWVPLAPIRDPALVTESIGQTLGARDSLADHIGEREMLLLLDNIEQVIEAAPDLASVVESCPNLRLLITSRELLRVRGEMEYPVLPLAEPDAVELFCARSRTEPDETIAELCRRLDDLPLAIELAAARTGVLSPGQILERLSSRLDLLKGGRDADPRQQTLRATIEWSHDLLTKQEQGLFARLAVFRGGCTLEAAEEVAGSDLDALQSLVDKSLLRHRGERFWMLETIREFAAERLEAAGELETMRQRHTDFLTALVEAAEPHLHLDESEWIERLEAEHDNLRAVLDRLADSGDATGLLDLAGKLYRFWYLQSHLKEGQRYLEAALQADETPTAARARALDGAAVMALNLGDRALARRRAGEALLIFQGLGDPWGEAYSSMMIGSEIAEDPTTLAEAVPYFEKSIRTFDAIGDEHFGLIARFNLAWVVGSLGDPARERALIEEIIRRAEDARDSGRWIARGPVERTIAMGKADLAMLERDEERFDAARDLLRDAIAALHHLGATMEVAINLGRLANVLALVGNGDTAARLMAKSDDLMEEMGIARSWWDRDRNEKTREILRTSLAEEALEEATRDGLRLTTDEAVALALDQVD
jgi:predicted ATPase